ncbi:MAG: isoquinoline 1-oxidoreductase alpha subunit [Cyclobacteriaceae bacterium]|jgi:isoquinoline 1-oxidoreductase alpha subunit
MKIDFILNGEDVSVEAPEDAILLWTLRERLKLTGTKFGCGISVCGACTVHLDGTAIRSCSTPLSMVVGREVTTIEGLDENNNHPLQVAYQEEQVPQCGYCQSGQIMQAVSLLNENPTPTDEQIISHMDGNLCRCGTYTRVLKAIKRVVKEGQS